MLVGAADEDVAAGGQRRAGPGARLDAVGQRRVPGAAEAVDALDADAIESELKEVVEYEENVSALQDLGIGRTDAVVVDKVVADWYIKDENADYKVLDETLAPELYGVAVKKGNTELLNKIQTAFDEIVADGTAAQISEKWFGSDIIYTGK